MAASDPTPYVATPTGVLQGVAAFSWDGSAWTPGSRSGPGVATPTGVLKGVAPFNWDGAAWQPAGRAGPGVATPTGTLDGVAVYTWSGSAWTPAFGGVGVPTPTGVLRGVAAFGWDGAAWQPASQARPSVPTPYGVLDGVAMFNWSGSTWVAGAAVPSGATLDLSFLSGALDPRITFTRASTATYFDSSGTLQTAATNAPRFDYDPATRALRGLLIEEARTNLVLNSGDAGNATWGKSGNIVAAPVVTGNQVTAPDGTTTAARVVYPAVTGAGAISELNLSNTFVATAASYTVSVWARGNVGGERVYLSLTPNGVLYYRMQVDLTTTWQRFVLSSPALTAANWFPSIGVDLRDTSQTATSAQTIFVWGGQVELGAFPTSYIPTTVAAVTRAIEVCQVPTSGWFSSTTYSLSVELIPLVVAKTYGGISDTNFANATYFNNSAWVCGTNIASVPSLGAGVVGKICSALVPATQAKVCASGGTVVSSSTTIIAAQATATRLAIGNDPWSLTTAASAWMRRVRYWPRVLSDAEMQSVTT